MTGKGKLIRNQIKRAYDGLEKLTADGDSEKMPRFGRCYVEPLEGCGVKNKTQNCKSLPSCRLVRVQKCPVLDAAV